MGRQSIVSGVLMDETKVISFYEMSTTYHITEAMLTEMVEQGLLNPPDKQWDEVDFDYRTVLRIRSAQRLQHDLGVNLPGVVLILDLLKELEEMQSQLHIVRRHVELP